LPAAAVVVEKIASKTMTRFTTAQRVLSIVALSVVAVTAAACSSAPVAGVGQPVAQTGVGGYANCYS